MHNASSESVTKLPRLLLIWYCSAFLYPVVQNVSFFIKSVGVYKSLPASAAYVACTYSFAGYIHQLIHVYIYLKHAW